MSDSSVSSEAADLNDNEIFEEVCAVLANIVEEYGYGETEEQKTMVANHLPTFTATRHRKKIKKRESSDRTDPRGHYLHSIVAFLSGFDMPGLHTWAETYLTPDFFYTERFVHYVPVYDLYLEYHTRAQYLSLLTGLLLAVPDVVINILASRFTRRQDGSSYVVARMMVNGTHTRRLLMTNPLHEIDTFIDRDGPFSYLYGTASAAGIIPPEQIKVAQAVSTTIVGESRQPSVYCIELTYVLYIGADHRAYRGEVMKRFIEKPLSVDPYDASRDDELFDGLDFL